MRYAIALRDLHLARTRPASRAVADSLADEQADVATVIPIDGVPALVLEGAQTAIAAHVAALVELDIPVYEATDRAATSWSRCRVAPVVAELPDELPDVRDAVDGHDVPEIDEQWAAWSAAIAPDDDLVAQIRRDGCRVPLVVWEETGILLDGHRRLAACRSVGEEWDTAGRSFGSRAAASRWILEQHLARTRLRRPARDYLVGQLHIAATRVRASSAADEPHFEARAGAAGKTAAILSSVAEVSRATVERTSAWARAVDRLAAAHGAEYRLRLLRGEIRLSRGAVLEAAAALPRHDAPHAAGGAA